MGVENKESSLNKMSKKISTFTIGIPRALHFYKFGPLWDAFLLNLGHEIRYSPPTTSKIVEIGSQSANSELCVPMKIYYGHVLTLIQENPDLDYIFIPRYVSTESDKFYCPKFLALPETVKYSLNFSVPILILEFNVKIQPELKSIIDFGQQLGHNSLKTTSAWEIAINEFNKFKTKVKNGNYLREILKIDKDESHKLSTKSIRYNIAESLRGKYSVDILLLGHPYNVYENYININLIDRLKAMDCNIHTIESMSNDAFENPVLINSKYHQYWQTEDEILKAARFFMEKKEKTIDGVIFLISFACGPDSLIQEIVMRDMKSKGIPFLALILDEHSGESGIVTRIQALIEMIRRKKYQKE